MIFIGFFKMLTGVRSSRRLRNTVEKVEVLTESLWLMVE